MSDRSSAASGSDPARSVLAAQELLVALRGLRGQVLALTLTPLDTLRAQEQAQLDTFGQRLDTEGLRLLRVRASLAVAQERQASRAQATPAELERVEEPAGPWAARPAPTQTAPEVAALEPEVPAPEAAADGLALFTPPAELEAAPEEELATGPDAAVQSGPPAPEALALQEDRVDEGSAELALDEPSAELALDEPSADEDSADEPSADEDSADEDTEDGPSVPGVVAGRLAVLSSPELRPVGVEELDELAGPAHAGQDDAGTLGGLSPLLQDDEQTETALEELIRVQLAETVGSRDEAPRPLEPEALEPEALEPEALEPEALEPEPPAQEVLPPAPDPGPAPAESPAEAAAPAGEEPGERFTREMLLNLLSEPAAAPAPPAPEPTPPAAAHGDDESTLLMSQDEVAQALRALTPPASPKAAQAPAPEPELLLEDDERLDERDAPARPAPSPGRADAGQDGLLDGYGKAILPTIKDPRTARPAAAAAVQLGKDGQAVALGRGLDYLDEIRVPLGPADDDDEPDHDGVLRLMSHEPEGHEEEVEDEATPEAPSLSLSDAQGPVAHAPRAAVDPSIDNAQIAVLSRQAQESLDRGDLQAAALAYSDLLDISPRSVEAYLGRGRCHLDLGDYAAAMSDFQKAEDLDPNGPEPLVAMGELFFARKDYARAIEFFNHAIELDSNHAMARCRRGISYYYKKSYREAFLDLQKAYNLDPEIPNIRKYVQMANKKLERSGEG